MSEAHPSFPSGVDRDNPWPGLASFTEDARGFFFGREKETDELSRLVRRQTLTVLFGQSGLGKSSLLHAGLFPLLRETDHLPLYLRLDHAPSTAALADQVKSALTDAFAAVKADAPAFRADETLWEYFHRKDVDIWSAKNRLLTPVLAFDQFEEIFTLGRADETCRERSRAFLAELACLVENRAPAAVQAKLDHGELDPARFNFTKPSCSVILSLREDFLPDLESLKQAMPALVHNRLRLKKLSGTQALEIVTKPAPHLLAEGVAEKIVEFVAGARGGSAERLTELDVEPPLLSVICRELNDRRRALRQEKITADLVSGNRREILTDFYERSVADLPAAMRNFIEDRLLTKSGFRDNFALETALEFPGVTQALIDTLVARRLLRVEDRLGLQRVELTHDVLAEVVRNARDARQQRIALAEAQERERLALEAVVRQARRQRFMIAGLALAVVGLCIGAFFGIRAQRRAAELAGQAELATGSRLLDEGKTGDGLAYLVAAARRDQGNSVAATRIMSTLAAHSFLLPVGTTLKLPSPATHVLLLADGRSALVLGEDSHVRVLDLAEWKVTREFSFAQKIQPQGLRVAAKNPGVFAVAFIDGTVQVCETTTGRPQGKSITPPNLAKGSQISGFELGTWRTVFAFSPDGRWLATNRGTTALFDASTGEERFHGEHFNLTMPQHFTTWNPFSPDSSRVSLPLWDLANLSGDFKAFSSASMLLSVPDGKVLTARQFEIADVAYGAKNFSADGTRVLMLGNSNAGKKAEDPTRSTVAVVCDAATLQPIGAEIAFPQTSGSNEFLLTPDGNRVILNLSGDRGARVFDAKTGQLAFPELPHGAGFTSVGLSDDGAIYATNSIDGQIRLWDLRTGSLFAESTFKLDRRGTAALSRDGRTLLVFSPTGEAYRLEVSRGPAAPLVLPRPIGVMSVSYVENAPARVLYFSNTATTMFDVTTGRQIEGGFALPQKILGTSRRYDDSTVHSGDVWIARTAAAGRTLWKWGESGAPRETAFAEPFPSAATPAPLLSQNRHLAAIGGQVSTGGGASTKPSSVTLWDLQTGKKISLIAAGEKPLWLRGDSTDFSSDDQRFVVREDADDGALRVYGIRDGKFLFQLAPEGSAGFLAARFTPDGKQLLTGNAWGTLQIWDGGSGKPLQSIQAHSYGLEGIDFSPDSRYYATRSSDGTAQVRDAATHEPVGAPLVHTATVNRVQFNADNTRVATSTITGAVRVWDLRTGLPLHDPFKHTVGNTPNLDFSADGKFLMTYYSSGTERATRLWAAPPDGPARPAPSWLLRLATICAGRRLNEEAKIVSALDEFDRFDELRREIAALPDDAPFAAWGKWFLSTDAARPIAPNFTVTLADAQKLAETLAKVPTPPPAPAPAK